MLDLNHHYSDIGLFYWACATLTQKNTSISWAYD